MTRPDALKAGRGYQSSWHLWPLGFRVGVGQRTARIASSKTFLRPLVVSAEHSRYLTAPTSLDIARPWKQKHTDKIKSKVNAKPKLKIHLKAETEQQ